MPITNYFVNSEDFMKYTTWTSSTDDLYNEIINGRRPEAKPKPKFRRLSNISEVSEEIVPKHIKTDLLAFMAEIERRVLSEVIAAGGMPRDLVHGLNYKDIDLYIQIPEGADVNKYVETVRAYVKSIKGDFKQLSNNNEKYEEKSILHVEHVYLKPELRFDIIFINKNVDDFTLENFDLSICKIIMETNGSFHYSDAFDKTIETGKVTFTKGMDSASKKNSLKTHWPRIQKKLPMYSLVINKVNNGRPL